MAANQNPLTRDREILAAAHANGPVATVLSFFRLSGPGWLQSAITLGGGSLTSALFLGVLGGYQMLWLQWIAIVLGVIMLSAISYVTLSSHLRPFDAINRHVNPILGCGWLLATLMANIIWCMPQFSLCYDTLENGIVPAFTSASSETAAVNSDLPTAQPVVLQQDVSANAGTSEAGENEANENEADASATATSDRLPFWEYSSGTLTLRPTESGSIVVSDAISKFLVSVVLFGLAFAMVAMSASGGAAAWWFDVLLKVIIGVIVICFFGTVIYLSREGALPWNEILTGFIPNLNHWFAPSRELAALLETLPAETAEQWRKSIVGQQRDVMIGTVATAVGINMTFLLPYSLLARGWDRTFRGLARFDLVFGMLIPFILVTSCVVITSAAAFHATADEAFLSADAAEIATSPTAAPASLKGPLANVYADEFGEDYDRLDEAAQRARLAGIVAKLPREERLIVASLVKRNSRDLSQTLAPLFTAQSTEGSGGDLPSVVPGFTGSQLSSLIFSIGALAMGFSTMIVLMLINGYVFAELFQTQPGSRAFLIGAAIAGVAGACWPLVWQGESKLWLAISASTFGFLLLPIAYFSFWLLMNSKSVLGEDRPEGFWRVFWNILLLVALGTTLLAAAAALWDKMDRDPVRGQLVLGAVICFIGVGLVGFFAANRTHVSSDYDLE